jgi:hypothetical protein
MGLALGVQFPAQRKNDPFLATKFHELRLKNNPVLRTLGLNS